MVSKKLLDNSEAAAEFLTLISNEKRLEILALLLHGEMTVGSIADRISLSQSALSQHLARLREQGLIAFRREAQTLHYHIADARAGQVLELLRDIFCPELVAVEKSRTG